MQLTKKVTDPCTYLLDIEVDAATVSKAFGRAYRDFAKFTRVPGFRPGHAPRKVLEPYVDADRLREHVMDILVSAVYSDALEQEHIIPYGDPNLEPGDLVEGEPWRFQVTVAGQPIVKLGDYSSLAVERPIVEVTDEDVESTIESIRRENAELKMAEGRGVKPDDVLIVDMGIRVEGQDEAKMPRSLVRLNQAIPGFAEAVAGQMPDETRSFSLTFPPDYHDESRAGKNAEFTVTIGTINEYVLPDINDEWVASNTEFATVAEWREEIRRRLNERMRESADDVALSRIIAALVAGATIEFPPAMLDDEIRASMTRLAQELERNRTSYEQFLSMSNLTREEHQERVEQEAELAIKTRLVSREFAQQEGLKLDHAAVEKELDELRRRADDAGIELIGTERAQRLRVANSMLHEQVRARLFEIAKITDVPVARSSGR